MDDAHPIGIHGPAPPTTEPAQPAPCWQPNAELLLEALRRYARDLSTGEAPADLESRLLQMQKLMTLGQITSEVAHDFSNLMTVVLGFSELLLTTKSPNGIDQGHIEGLHAAAERAASLTAQLLGYTRETGCQPTHLDLAELVRRLESMLRRLLNGRAQLAVSLPTEPATICADPRRIEQAIINLTLNARDALRDRGQVRIAVEHVLVAEPFVHTLGLAPPGDYVALRVSDNGVGIDAETRQRVFEPFFTTKERGTGLGLAIVVCVARQSRAAVTLESEPGVGATFSVHFPLNRPVHGPAS